MYPRFPLLPVLPSALCTTRLLKVCMVCFDGSTDEDHNQYIVYCDGCGMSVHMDCYGIKNVEADFCCERCSKLRELEAES